MQNPGRASSGFQSLHKCLGEANIAPVLLDKASDEKD